VNEVGEGARAPEFELPDQDGVLVRSADLLGRPLVVYFFPKADTPG
jgi:thioredoxin-dependent peroxiredoxin